MGTNSTPELFLEISAFLTGFTETELTGTGMLATYYNAVLSKSPPQAVASFFADMADFLHNKPDDPAKVMKEKFMPLDRYNGLTQYIINMWYTGNWGLGYNGVVISAASYIQGLMWETGHTHPAGAKQPGYASWAFKPLTVK